MSRFGERLRYYRRQCQDPERGGQLTQERLGELLGYTGAAVSEWELGKSQINKDERRVLLALIQALHQCRGIHTPDQANDLLWAGDYRPLDKDEQRQIFPDWPSNQSQVLWPPNIPKEPYYSLPGRERDLSRLLELLQQPTGPAVIAIDGLGGMGKTAVAVELARRLLDQKLFEGVVGDSAKQEILSGGEIVQVREATLDLDGLLDAIARQLGRWEIATLKAGEKPVAVAALLRQHRYLVLLDNLETVENANALVAHVRGLLDGSRVIVTSRRKVQHGFAQSLSLAGLEEKDSLFFLRAEAEQRAAQQVLKAPKERLVEIHEVTGGAPLAMKLVVAQSQFLDLERILRQLRQAGGKLYPFIFRQSWQQLSPTAQRVLIYIGQTVVTTVGLEELASVDLAENESDLFEAIEQLMAYSLLDASFAGEVRYGIHQLTRQFVTSDLPEIWREQGLM